MKNLILGVMIAVLSNISNLAMADTVKAGNKATARLVASCTISATSVSLGVLVLPLNNQSSTGQLNVLCSNKATYTIDMAYGGVYGTGTGSPNQVYVSINNGHASYYNTTTGTFGNATSTNCGYAGCIPTGYVNSQTTVPASYGGLCAIGGNGCAVYWTNPSYYSYGVLNGTAKGDKIGYYIGLPNDNTKVWNTGNNSYTGIGTGKLETIAVKVNVLTNRSSSLYPAPDFYMDTVTSKVTF